MSEATGRGSRIESSAIEPQDHGLYLYGIGLRARHHSSDESSKSADDVSITEVVAGDLIAFAKVVRLSDFDEEAMRAQLQDKILLMEAVQQHHMVVSSLYQRSPILPAKFGSIYGSEDSLLQMLESHVEQITKRLMAIDECDEWAIHIFREDDAIVEEVIASSPELRDLNVELENASEGRAYLLRQQIQKRLSSLIEDHESSLARSILEELQEWVAGVQIEDPADPQEDTDQATEIARASVLVQRGNTDSFLSAANQAADARAGVRIEISGPWPAYSFAQFETGEWE